ncbi:MAG: class I tRNA ligase family protein [Patescibacteria group bacterium]|nr:class I tRNA ligase family protein [Patescibacteria group bacterium]
MTRFHLPTIEEGELKRWEEKGVLRQILERNEIPKENPRGNFVFFEGPPTANGKPGIHHILARGFKDAILRYRTMRGYRVDRKAGWDTHGLPVELEVEKQLGFTKKQEIEEYGVAKFNKRCRESVWKYLDQWEKMTQRIGFWVDLDDPYITYKNEYIESLWWILKEIHDKQVGGQPLLYEGHRTTPHCPRCVTSLSSHELAQGYKDVEDVSVFVKFAVKGKEDLSFLVWTTTPWTLPANMALAVGEHIDYVEARLEGSGERVILAKTLLGALEADHKVVAEMSGAALSGMEYEPLYAIAPKESLDKAYRVYAGDFVSVEDGTGIVHIAPAYGEDDAELGRQEGIPPVMSVDATGIMGEGMPGAGKSFKEADEDVKADLKGRGLLYKEEKYTHSYPHCWRCGTPLIYYAKKSWYIAMSKLRDQLIKNNNDINWVPSHIRDGRFGEWLREVKDWALSRERYWGTPLPIWKCVDCERTQAIGGLDDFDNHAVPMNEYFLQRHGEAEHNVKRIVTGWDESMHSELSEVGIGQIEDRAEEYADAGIDVIYASDIHRCKRTAEMIAGKTGAKVHYDERLRDIKAGEFEGKSEDDFHAFFKTSEERIDKELPGGGESLRQQRQRMVAFLKEIDGQYEGKRILFVSHGDPTWALRSGIMQLDDKESLNKDLYLQVGGNWSFNMPRRPRDDEGKVDMHRPFVDDLRLKCACGGEMVREPDVIDVWFDSGAMPFAQWGYPHDEDSAERIDKTNYPADYISEAIDQTRGWFYTLLAISTLLDRGTSYKNVICLGHVLDAKGQKMSKSKGNVVDPWVMMDKWGADAIRYYFFTVNQPGEPKRFDEKGIEEITKKVFLILWNVLSFHKMFAPTGAPPEALAKGGRSATHVLDRWLLAELDALTKGITEDLEAYHIVDACRRINGFVTDLSTWYVRRSRARFKAGDSEASATLGHVLMTLSKLMTPFAPFLSDALYGELGGKKDSVHLDMWPEQTEEIDEKISRDMKWVRLAASAGLEKREEAKIPVRQALAKATVTLPLKGKFWMAELLTEELNVLEVEFVKGETVDVVLDTEITPELRRMGLQREIVRNVNSLRKEAGLTPADRVILKWEAESELWIKTIEEHGGALQSSVRADGLERGRTDTEFSKEIEADGETLWIGFNKS